MILAIDQGTTGTTLPRLRRAGRADRPGLPRVHPALPAARLGRARRARDLGGDAGRRRRGAATTPARAPATSTRSASPTSARPSACGIPPAASRCTTRSSGRTGARPRAARSCATQGHEPLVRARTGLVLDPYFSATKIEWLLEHVDGLRERAQSGRALFGTIDSWLIFKLTGEHVTDATNASRTLLYDIGDGPLGPRAARAVRRSRARAAARARQRGRRSGRRAPDALHGHAVPVCGRRRRPAGGAVRPGVRRPGHGQEHLRDRLVRAAQRRLHRARAAARAADDGRPAASGERRARTRWRRRSSSTGAAVQWLRDGLRHHRARPSRPRRSRARWTATTACTSCRRSPAWARRTGTRTRAARSSG